MDRPPDDRPPEDQPQSGEGVDEFDAIVSDWRREGPVPVWPADDAELPGDPDLPETTVPPVPPIPDEGHFVPPEPPPLPRIGPPAAVGLVLLVAGIVLVAAPGWLGVSSSYGLPLGLLALAAGLGWLVLRLWPRPPAPGEHDDGAVV